MGMVPAGSLFDDGRFKVADVTGDSIRDFILIGSHSTQGPVVAVRRGLGDGTFAPTQITPIPLVHHYDIYHLSVGDLNGDGANDLVASDFGANMEVFVSLTSDRDGTFTLAYSESLQNPGESIGSGWDFARLIDVTGDGKLDFAGSPVHVSPKHVHYFLGRGDGTFDRTRRSLTALDGAYPLGRYIAAGHFNTDNKPDFAFVQVDNSPTVRYFARLSNPSGGYTLSELLSRPSANAPDVDSADMDGDGVDELLLHSDSDSQHNLDIYRFVGEGIGLVESVNRYPVHGLNLATGDVNGDGYTDLGTSGVPVVLMGEPGGGLSTRSFPPDVEGDYFCDFNNDGLMDILSFTPSEPNWTYKVHLAGPGNQFTLSASLARPLGLSLWPERPLDVNGDGNEDIFADVSDGTVFAFYGNGAGQFAAPVRIAHPAPPIDDSIFNGNVDQAIAIDFDHDGLVDRVGISGNTSLKFARNVGNGEYSYAGLASIHFSTFDTNALASETGDFDGDGIPDLFLLSADSLAPGFKCVVLRGLPAAPYFAAPIETAFVPSVSYDADSIRILDADLDGADDVAFYGRSESPSGSFLYVRGLGDGTFANRFQAFVVVDIGWESLEPHDFDADGDPDFLTTAGIIENFSPFRSRAQVHADFANRGPAIGDVRRPYARLSQALGAVSENGIIVLRGGPRASTEETLTIDFPVTLTAIGGSVRIGNR